MRTLPMGTRTDMVRIGGTGRKWQKTEDSREGIADVQMGTIVQPQAICHASTSNHLRETESSLAGQLLTDYALEN